MDSMTQQSTAKLPDHMFEQNTLSAEQFDDLLQSTGLAEIVKDFRQRGYTIRVQSSQEHYAGTRADTVRKELLFHHNSLHQYNASETDNFVTTILYILGCFTAFERGLNHKDKDIGWQIAEEISPVPLSNGWNTIKAQSVILHSLPHRGSELTAYDSKEYLKFHRCPVCHKDQWRRYDESRLIQGFPSNVELVSRCMNCSKEILTTMVDRKLCAFNVIPNE